MAGDARETKDGTTDNVLTVEQQVIVEDRSRVLRVLAGAGSGKTHTLVHCVHHAVENGLAVPHRIAAITFTRDAAANLGHRVDRISPGLAKDVETGTFHAFATRRSRDRLDFLPTPRQYKIAEGILRRRLNGSTDDRRFMLALLNGEDDHGERLRAVLGLVSYCKNWESASVDVLRRQYPQIMDEGTRVRRILMEYERGKGEFADFDDVLLTFRDNLRDDAAFRKRMRERLDLLLVDEYQDMNGVQQEIVLLLTHPRYDGRAARFVAVGDERQAIYGFRGARADLFLDLHERYPGGHVRTLPLTRNFRSTKRILETANNLYPEHDAPLAPRPRARAGTKVKLQGYAGMGLEAAGIIRAVERRLVAGASPGSIAILARARWQLYALEKMIEKTVAKRSRRSSARPSAKDRLPNVWRGTIHAAKGLEWEHVFLMGAHEGGIPNDRVLAAEAAGAPEVIASERRLFYVAVTRAKETCTVTHMKTARGVSRFAEEAGLAPRSRPVIQAPALQVPMRGRARAAPAAAGG